MSQAFKTVDIFPGQVVWLKALLRFGEQVAHGHSRLHFRSRRNPLHSRHCASALRASVREHPETYYAYLAGRISREDLIAADPQEWNAACDETAMLELGTERATAWLDPVLDRIEETAQAGTILIGGPPCQAYSLVGRARNRGIRDYDPATDHRHFLYREYIDPCPTIETGRICNGEREGNAVGTGVGREHDGSDR